MVFSLVSVIFPLYWLTISAFKLEQDYRAYPPVFFPSQLTLDSFIEVFTKNQLMNNLINYIFPEGEKVDDAFGIPLNLIVDKHGKLLKSYNRYSGEMRVHPRGLYYIKDKDVREIDFSQMDTLNFDWEPFICTGSGCKL